MKKSFIITIVLYLVFGVISIFEFSNESYNKLENIDGSYFLKNLDTNIIEQINSHTSNNDIMFYAYKDTNKSYDIDVYGNDTFKDEYSNLFFIDSKYNVESINNSTADRIKVNIIGSKDEFEEILVDLNVLFNYDDEFGSYGITNISYVLLVVLLIISIHLCFSNVATSLKQSSLQLINGYSKLEVMLILTLKNLKVHLVSLIIMFSAIIVFFYFNNSLSFIFSYTTFFFQKYFISWIVVMIVINLVNVIIFIFDHRKFLKNNDWFKMMNVVNFVIRTIITTILVFSTIYTIENIYAYSKVNKQLEMWENIKDYRNVNSLYDIYAVPSEEQLQLELSNYKQAYLNNIEHSFFISVSKSKYTQAYVGKNYFKILPSSEYDLNACDKCINVILNKNYKKDEVVILTELNSKLRNYVATDYEIVLKYVDDFSLYSYDLEYDIKNDNFVNNPIVIVENPQIMSDNFYLTIGSSFYTIAKLPQSKYYIDDFSAMDNFNMFNKVQERNILYGSIVVFLSLSIHIMFNTYLTRCYINSYLKKIMLLRLNGYNSLDIYYPIYSYVIITYISLAFLYFFLTKDNLEFLLNYYVGILFIFIIDLVYLTYNNLRIELKQSQSFLKGELL